MSSRHPQLCGLDSIFVYLNQLASVANDTFRKSQGWLPVDPGRTEVLYVWRTNRGEGTVVEAVRRTRASSGPTRGCPARRCRLGPLSAWTGGWRSITSHVAVCRCFFLCFLLRSHSRLWWVIVCVWKGKGNNSNSSNQEGWKNRVVTKIFLHIRHSFNVLINRTMSIDHWSIPAFIVFDNNMVNKFHFRSLFVSNLTSDKD